MSQAIDEAKWCAMADHLVNLRLTSKQMQRGAKKCEQGQKDATGKLKKAIKDQNQEGARIYAQVRLLGGR